MAGRKKYTFPFTKQDALSLIFALAITAVALFLSTKISAFSEYGYAGVFLISLISSATVLIPVPGFAVVIALAAALDPILLGVAAGLGSGLGELSGYFLGYAGHDAVTATKTFRSHKKQIEKYGAPAIFALAFIPNPLFDVAGIAAGSIKMKWWKFLLATCAGKVLRFILLAYLGLWASGWF
ncbi:MAG: VTT domain-containing protein [Candidatus Micrarchaeota archaeon]|nr:VTT domain-containing protein [Candidatus Micrarchaeota archaeon]